MRKIIGATMIAAPVLALLVLMTIAYGKVAVILGVLLAVAIIASISVGVFLIED